MVTCLKKELIGGLLIILAGPLVGAQLNIDAGGRESIGECLAKSYVDSLVNRARHTESMRGLHLNAAR